MSHLNRRRFVFGLGTAALAPTLCPAWAAVPDSYANLVRSLMGRVWLGTAYRPEAGSKGGQFVSTLGMSFELDQNWNFEGIMFEMARFEGRVFEGEFTIGGNAWVAGTAVGMSITRMDFKQGTKLPEGMFWTTSTGSFRFFKDSKRPGHFTMEGTRRDARDGIESRVVMQDKE